MYYASLFSKLFVSTQNVLLRFHFFLVFGWQLSKILEIYCDNEKYFSFLFSHFKILLRLRLKKMCENGGGDVLSQYISSFNNILMLSMSNRFNPKMRERRSNPSRVQFRVSKLLLASQRMKIVKPKNFLTFQLNWNTE